MGDISDLFGQPFDSSQVEPSTVFEPLPTGWYQCVATESCVKTTKAGTGKYIFICWQVLDGQQCSGRKVFSRHNVQNKSQQTMKIAEGEMSAIARAIKIPILEETSQLVGQACEIRVVIKNEQNDVKGFRPIGVVAAATDTVHAVPAVPAVPVPCEPGPPPVPSAGDGTQLRVYPAPVPQPAPYMVPPQPAQPAHVVPDPPAYASQAPQNPAVQPPWMRPQ